MHLAHLITRDVRTPLPGLSPRLGLGSLHRLPRHEYPINRLIGIHVHVGIDPQHKIPRRALRHR
eukprot:863331-Pyramimonas_sp.AAC.1